ncbi:acyl carrier protein [Pseudobutyrivibrio ruminis]|uniref:Acyl carrier protein n=1 Tax=Pseudobutyrivibrio ruminis TaxID=46206 RepID=A0A1H7LMG5_9FIRM|nr:acyl carrier protein [Pseudobutyrivibrio ruminis]MBE5914510.1 acyl carrier protein [Pseudobutyrivibrio ruminis]SEL00192.1 acyl carrier protein [Pseudobutyrivibrio ruminis]
MERKELEAQIIKMVAQCYNADEAKLSVDSEFGKDISGTSVMMVGLVSEIENELDAMIQLSDAAACKTIGDLVDKVEEEL